MSQGSEVYLRDMLEAADNVLEFTRDLSFDEFGDDKKTYHAVLRNLEVLGEAAKRVPQDVQSANPDIEWRRITGLRDVLIHQYFRINLLIVWDIVSNKLPTLRRQIEAALEGSG